ncbi:hypothetical protein [Nocardia fluminea]
MTPDLRVAAATAAWGLEQGLARRGDDVVLHEGERADQYRGGPAKYFS